MNKNNNIQEENYFHQINKDNEKILFKGWILTYEINNYSSIDASNNSLLNNPIKWSPKFLVVNKFDKNITLYDYEPTNKIVNQDNADENDLLNYRIDNFINRDLFVNFWRNNKCLLDLDVNIQQPIITNGDSKFNRDLSPLRENINHHLSNKEIESLNSNYESDLINSYNNKETKNSLEVNTTTTTLSATSAFRLLFFKKSVPKQHSSLKRAKSGIQLDRKKYNSTMGTSSSSPVPPPSSSSSSTISSATTNNKINIINNGIMNPNYLDNNHKINLPNTIRHSRSHECLSPTIQQNQQATNSATVLNSDQILFIDNSFENSNTCEKLNEYDINSIQINLKNDDLKQINTLHPSLLNQDNCFEIKYELKDDQYKKRFFLCRSTDERDKWLFILKYLLNTNYNYERRYENTLQLWILEAKGGQINSSSNKIKKYFCEIYLNNSLFGKTCIKEKKDILFWGENFTFNTLKSEHLRLELYHDSIDNTSKKKKKDSLTNKDPNKLTNNLLGFIHIPLNTIDLNQPIEKWYRLENSTDLLSTSVSLSSSNNTLSTINVFNTNNEYINSSKTTTHDLSNGKDSILIRVKAKYNCVDILPLCCYNQLIKYIQDNYLKLMQILEPHLNVRTKDDLSNTLVRIAFKLQIVNNYLNDLIISEILDLEDTSLIFRGNSLATKSMESYLKLVGESYLKYTLCDIVKSIIETNHDLEIDPSKVINQNSLQANREELIQILHLVCGRVFNSCNHFPKELRNIFCLLRENCLKNGKTDEMCDMLISASIFLRFICPAILSPNLFNLTQEYPQEKAARKLTLAAKTLQTIANFSKFGGKEFYMSFDKMNKFVDEHTILMREFLRNISTKNSDNLSANNSSTNSLSSESTTSSIIENKNLNDELSNNTNIKYYNNELKSHKESVFNCDLIDFGKQLSILHTLLVQIFTNLDKVTIEKLKPLSDILLEINNFKQKIKFNELLFPSNTINEINQNGKIKNCNTEKEIPIITTSPSDINVNKNNQTVNINSHSTAPTNYSKLIVYDNPIHHAIINKQEHHQSQQSINFNNNLNSIPIKIVSAALDGVNSVTNIMEKKLLHNNSNDNSSNLTLSNESSSSSPPSPSLTYSSEATINLVNIKSNCNNNNNPYLKENYSPNEQLNSIMRRLSETEFELKREQEEKLLIEIKFKQQEQEHDQQMRNLINRLIKVEEELKREKIEMNRLLKAKQEIIDVQKKRIEGMANRLAHTQYQNQQTRYINSNNKFNHNYQHNQHQPQQHNQNLLKINHNNSNTIKAFSTPINAAGTPMTTFNSDLRNHHPHVNNVTLNTSHFLRTSEL